MGRETMNEPLFDSLTCSRCGGTMTRVSETEAVCANDERHRWRTVEHSLFKGSLGLHVGYQCDYTNNLTGKKFTYRIVQGKPHLRIGMSHNLGSRADDIAYDARELVEKHSSLVHFEIMNEGVVRDFARRAQVDSTGWILELEFGSAGNFLYTVTNCILDDVAARFDVRFAPRATGATR
jgi:hypothetical protein